jgi:hypothetical protein
MSEPFDVIVVGSGAGGGVVAGELAQCGRKVLLLEAGPHLKSADFRRWEAKADHDLYWPLRFAPLPDGDVLTFLSGRCVGGSTTINTKVALRAHERDVAKWHPASGLTNERGDPFSLADLGEYYDRVESVLHVRERDDWEKCVRTAQLGFRALGADLEPVMSYTDAQCMKYGSCLQGCPTDGGKSTMNTYIARALDGVFLLFLQNIINKDHQLLVKYDWFDPNTDVVPADMSRPGNNFTDADVKFSTLGLGYVYHFNPETKIIFYYDIVRNERSTVTGYPDDLEDNIFNCRLQFRF